MASLMNFFLGENKKSANVAKERLQIILAHERATRTGGSPAPDYLEALQRDVLAVVRKYIDIDPKDIQINLEREENLEILEVKIELPDTPK
jgi:cell division topological specificity factor